MNNKRTPGQIMSKLPYEVINCKQLLSSSTISMLHRSQIIATECNKLSCTLNKLNRLTANCSFTSITIKNDFFIWDRVSKNWCIAQLVSNIFDHIHMALIQLNRTQFQLIDKLLQQLNQESMIFNVFMMIIRKSQVCLKLLFGGQKQPILHDLNMLRSQGDSFVTH